MTDAHFNIPTFTDQRGRGKPQYIWKLKRFEERYERTASFRYGLQVKEDGAQDRAKRKEVR